MIAALVRRPDLWPTAIGAGRTLVPAGWWRRRPFLPVPDQRYLRFRLVTAYGGEPTGAPTADDVITWLSWRRRFPTPPGDPG